MIDFKPSAGMSIGVELEFQLLDPVTFDLVDGILPLKNLCSENPHIIPEYEQTTVEINSRICCNIREMEQDVLSAPKETSHRAGARIRSQYRCRRSIRPLET